MQPVICTTETIVRREDGGLDFVGPDDDPRREAVARISAAEGGLANEADLAMIADLFIIDENAINQVILIIG